jgi:hypothetical protein
MTIKMGTVQIIARTIAMLCVPIVMLAKPLSREMGGNEDIFSISVILFTMIIFHIATQCTSNAVSKVSAGTIWAFGLCCCFSFNFQSLLGLMLI